MRIAVSNIAWPPEFDDQIAPLLARLGVTGVEVAPTRIWSNPLETTSRERRGFRRTWETASLPIVAMQALLYGRNELSIFGTPQQRRQTVDYLAEMIRLAADLGARVLVFGSPKNRQAGSLAEEEVRRQSVEVFRTLGEQAEQVGCVFCVEANPAEYQCDFITNTAAALALVDEVAHAGFGLHLDSGGIVLAGDEPQQVVKQSAGRIEHFHASEAFLQPAGSAWHGDFAQALRQANYSNWVSLEMRCPAEEPLPTLIGSIEQIVTEYGDAASLGAGSSAA